jgi:hypothetical protein
MKKQRHRKQLSLDIETVRQLDHSKLTQIVGGAYCGECGSAWCPPPPPPPQQ